MNWVDNVTAIPKHNQTKSTRQACLPRLLSCDTRLLHLLCAGCSCSLGPRSRSLKCGRCRAVGVSPLVQGGGRGGPTPAASVRSLWVVRAAPIPKHSSNQQIQKLSNNQNHNETHCITSDSKPKLTLTMFETAPQPVLFQDADWKGALVNRAGCAFDDQIK